MGMAVIARLTSRSSSGFFSSSSSRSNLLTTVAWRADGSSVSLGSFVVSWFSSINPRSRSTTSAEFAESILGSESGSTVGSVVESPKSRKSKAESADGGGCIGSDSGESFTGSSKPISPISDCTGS